MDIIEYQTALLSGKRAYLRFGDGSSCIADSIDDILCAEAQSVRIEIVDPTEKSDNVMHIAIIDADLIGRDRHRFPNLASEKISAYWKKHGANVDLVLSYDDIDGYDQVYVSKVFTETPCPDWLQESDTVHLGGTGFFFDKAPNLPYEIEHHMPDYHLYDGWINRELLRIEADCKRRGKKLRREYYLGQFKEYLEFEHRPLCSLPTNILQRRFCVSHNTIMS